MSAFYGEMADIAREIMEEFAQGVVTLTRISPGEPIPGAQPWDPPPPPVTHTYRLDAAVKGVSEQYVGAPGVTGPIIGTDREVTCSDKMVLVAIDDDPVDEVESILDVKPGDVVAIDGEPITVLKTIRIPAAGIAVAHKFIIR